MITKTGTDNNPAGTDQNPPAVGDCKMKIKDLTFKIFICLPDLRIIIFNIGVWIPVRPTENDLTRLFKNGNISAVIICS